MKLYMWKRKEVICLSKTKPERATEDDLLSRVIVGDIISPLDAICTIKLIPEPLWPAENEIKEVLFYEELWDKAKDFPDYNKANFKNLQRLLGD